MQLPIAFSLQLLQFFYCRNVLEEMNGTAVDAAIATLFCNGLISSHSMGIGGGFLMTIYERSKNKVSTIDAREAAPAAVRIELFQNLNCIIQKKNVTMILSIW